MIGAPSKFNKHRWSATPFKGLRCMHCGRTLNEVRAYASFVYCIVQRRAGSTVSLKAFRRQIGR